MLFLSKVFVSSWKVCSPLTYLGEKFYFSTNKQHRAETLKMLVFHSVCETFNSITWWWWQTGKGKTRSARRTGFHSSMTWEGGKCMACSKAAPQEAAGSSLVQTLSGHTSWWPHVATCTASSKNSHTALPKLEKHLGTQGTNTLIALPIVRIIGQTCIDL